MSGLRPVSSCFAIVHSVSFMTTFVASSVHREECHDNVLKHCPYAAHASTACISQKSGMSAPSCSSGRSSSSLTLLPLSHTGPSMSNQDAFLRVPAIVDNLWRSCGAFVFLLWHARLSKTFRLMLPYSSHFVVWFPVVLFFLASFSLPVNALALHARPTPDTAIVPSSPAAPLPTLEMFRRQFNSSSTAASSSTDISSSAFSLPPLSSISGTPTSVGISISIVLTASGGSSGQPTSQSTTVSSDSQPLTSQSSSEPTSQPPSTSPTTATPSAAPTSLPTSQPPSSRLPSSPTSQSTSQPPPPPSTQQPSSSPASQPPSSSPTSIPPSSIPASSSSSTIASSNSMPVTTSSSPTLSLSTSSSLSSSPRSETTVGPSSTFSGSLTSFSNFPTSLSITLSSTQPGSPATSFSVIPASSPSTEQSTTIPPSTTFSPPSSTSSDNLSTSRASTSSRPVLQPSPTLTSSDVTSSQTSASGSFSTVFTTIVFTSTFSNLQGTGTTTLTTVVVTGTLIPNAPNSSNSNLLAHHPGAIAGVVIGSVAFVGLLVAWLFIARRRHQVAVQEAEAAVLSGPHSGGGRTSFGRGRTLVLDDDSRSVLPQPRMSELYTSVPIVRGSAEYGRLHSGLPEPEEIISPDNPPGVVEVTAGTNPRRDSPGTREDDELMKNNSREDVNEAYIARVPRSPMSQRSRASSLGPDPGAWLGNRDTIFTPAKTISPQPSTPGFGHSSSEGHGHLNTAIASGSSDMVHLMAPQNDTVHSIGSLSGHGSGEIMSMSALPYAGGSGSSEHGHSPVDGSSSGHGGGNSSQGHAASSGASHSRRTPFPEGRKSTGPSSLLPTQTQAPLTLVKNVEDEKKGRRRSFLGKPLRWRIRGGRPASTSSVSSMSNYSQPSPTRTLSFSGRPLSADMPAHIPSPSLPPTRSSSLRRSHVPSLSSLPPPGLHVHSMYAPHEDAIPEDQVPPEASHWQAFTNPAMPSPALTDRSSQNLPDGLLDPRLGIRLGGGAGSSAAISLRDDQDYSRPIGGFVHNRMYSTTTIPTVGTQSYHTTSRRNSEESHQTRRYESGTGTPQEEFIAL